MHIVHVRISAHPGRVGDGIDLDGVGSSSLDNPAVFNTHEENEDDDGVHLWTVTWAARNVVVLRGRDPQSALRGAPLTSCQVGSAFFPRVRSWSDVALDLVAFAELDLVRFAEPP